MRTLASLIGNEDEFPVLRKWNFLNHAGVSPLPRVAAEAIRQYAGEAETGAYIGTRWFADIEQLRRTCARLINADKDEIAFVKNTSEGLSIVANGIDWRPGDVIVTTNVEYPANIYPWMQLERTHGIKLVLVEEIDAEDGSRFVPEEKILEAAADPKCRMVTLSHVQYASGQRMDVARIGSFCRANGKLFCVDAIQSVGVLPVDVRAMNIDYLSADSHKWMLGPEGAGFFYIRRELIERTKPLSVGWLNVIDAQNYGDYDLTFKPDASRYECGSLNVPGLLGMKASLDLISEVGMDAIAGRVKSLGDGYVEQFVEQGCRIISGRSGERWSGAVSFLPPSGDLKEIVTRLRRDHQTEIALREGRLRVSPHFYSLDQSVPLAPADH